MCLSRDICPILKDPAALAAVIDLFEEHVRENHQHVDLIAGNTLKTGGDLNLARGVLSRTAGLNPVTTLMAELGLGLNGLNSCFSGRC